MPRQNRVDPFGRIVAHETRGLLMGNRGGELHDAAGVIRREQVGRAWIICRTDFKGRQREVGAPGQYTELFFLDEATALSAGHRPCFECRRSEATDFLARWRRTVGDDAAPLPQLDATLAEERRVPRSQVGQGKRAYRAAIADLPDGAIVDAGGPHLVHGGALRPWTPSGYSTPVDGVEDAWVLTPRTAVAVLARGYRPQLHRSADPR